jgi:hypothetical protein
MALTQSKTGTFSFSWSKTIHESRSFPVSATSVSVSLDMDLSLRMPVGVGATSNASTAHSGSNAWIRVSMTGQSARVSGSISAGASVGSTSKSASRSLDQSFTTPLGKLAPITLPNFSIPAFDAGIGQLSIDITPIVSFQGSVHSNATGIGPCKVGAGTLHWTSPSSQQALNVTMEEQKDISIDLNSAVFVIDKLEVGAEIGATLSTLLGSQSMDLGYFGLPVQTTIPVDGTPSSVVVAEYMPPTPPTPVISFLTASIKQDSYCYAVEQSISFSAASSTPGSGIITNFTWNFGDNSPNVQTQGATHYYSSKGTYLVTVNLRNSDRLSRNVTESISVVNKPLVVPTTTLYWLLIGVGSIFIGGIGWVFVAKRKRGGNGHSASFEEEGVAIARVSAPVVADDYGTGAFCPIDNEPLDGSTTVLKCPGCGTYFHEGCLLSFLELRSSCTSCGCNLQAE